MKTLFIDTSALLAVLFGESGSAEVIGLFREADQVVGSGLLEAEARSVAARKGLPVEEVDKALAELILFQPERSLTFEIKTVLATGQPLRGADLWHVACALYLAGNPSALPFVTLDQNQALAAARLGFKVLPGSLTAGSVIQEPRAAFRADKPKKKRKK